MLRRTRTNGLQEQDLFKVPLVDIVCPEHVLFQLAERLDWLQLEAKLTGVFSAGRGRPSHPARLMIGLLLLRQWSGLGMKATLAQWQENPYWQYFTGGNYFEHQAPVSFYSLARWQHRLKHCGIEQILVEMAQQEPLWPKTTPEWAKEIKLRIKR